MTATVLLAGVLLPLLPLLIWAFSGQWRYPAVLPQHASARGLRLLSDPRSQIPQALLTSTAIAVAVAAGACLIGFPAGRAIGLYRFRGRRLVQFLLLAPVIVPGLAVTLGLQVFFIRYGLADTLTGVVLVQLMPSVPYAATVLAGAFANYDLAYERQARALGAGPLRVMMFVTVPLLRPALLVSALFAFLISWSEYVLTLLIGGGQTTTLPLLLFAAISSSDTTAAAALALLFIAPPLLLVAAASHVLSAGTGAVIGFGRL
ncbi:ABC transporter permease [Kribbella qitaiheensis]|uniref:ABC transporter permease n=1 Tax=Kribbella qitaiheensis TaxID=1544730 RepID=UPI0019D5D76C|nr:ABC transporter permease subunit [Kribbella qitaiheensis]